MVSLTWKHGTHLVLAAVLVLQRHRGDALLDCRLAEQLWKKESVTSWFACGAWPSSITHFPLHWHSCVVCFRCVCCAYVCSSVILCMCVAVVFV